MHSPGQGTIITFHAYKGGAGTSTTVANTAWLLASAGKRVLAIDWDLDAPSLHRFFGPFLTDPALTSTEGLLDAVMAFAEPAMPPPGLQSFAVSVDWEFPNGGMLDLLPAGRLDPAYPMRVSAFAWQPFIASAAGVAFLQALRGDLRREYDYILVDTSSGLRDTTALDTIRLPDKLCLCFTFNAQAVTGCRRLAELVAEARTDDPVAIFPIAMRADIAEKQLLDEQRASARGALGPFIAHLGPPEQQHRYWRDVEFPYVPFHSYSDALPVFLDRPGDATSVSAVNERLCAYVTDGEVKSTTYPPEDAREKLLARYRASS